MNRNDLHSIIRETASKDLNRTIGNDDKFTIDSFAMMLLLTSIEEKFGVSIEIEQFDFDEPVTVESLSEMFIKNQRRQ